MTNTPYGKTRHTTLLILLGFVIFLVVTGQSEAQVSTNIETTATLRSIESGRILPNSPGLGTEVKPSDANGNTTVITGGIQAGPNLFHSFNRFDVGTRAIAQFLNSGIEIAPNTPPSTISNIFARVTGGQASQIDGTIQTEGFGSASLWFMNPSGIIFGPNAALDIGGSAVFTTANILLLNTPGFATDTSAGRVQGLSVADVTSFGFLDSAGAITINESNLIVPSGQTLSFVAGDINVVGANLRAPNGAVRVTSVDSSGGSIIRDPQTGTHSYSIGNRQTSFDLGTFPGTITLGQRSNGKDVEINGREIQLNAVTYTGSSATGSNVIDSTPQAPPAIVIQNGSLLVANLPRTRLIVSSPAVASLTPDPTTLDVGGNSNLNVTLNQAFIKPVDVRVASTDPTVASIASSDITVPAGTNIAPVQVQGVASGNTSVRATIGQSSAAASVVVNPVPPPFDSNLNPTPLTLVEGNSGTVTVTLNQPAPEDITVTFTSSDPTVLTAPRSVTISEGRTSANGSYTTLQPGSATVTASLQAGTTVLDTAVSPSIRVNPLQLTSLSPNLTIQEGESGTLTLTLSQEAPRDIPVTFTSSNPTDVPAPAATSVPEGRRTIPVPVEGVDDGRAIITASYEGDTAAATVLVTNFPGDGGTGGGGTGGGGTGGDGTFLGSLTGNSPVNQAVSAKTPADAKLLQPIPAPPPNRLVIASDRCSGGAKGEFSSFVQGGRDASRTQPGGLLASPLRFEDETPQISSITIQPGELSVRAIGPLNVAPAAMAFLQKGGGC